MKAKELIEMLNDHPNADVVVMRNENYEDKHDVLSPYCDSEGKIVIQYWDAKE